MDGGLRSLAVRLSDDRVSAITSLRRDEGFVRDTRDAEPRRLAETTARGRQGSTDEIARAVAFLASDDAPLSADRPRGPHVDARDS
jgi:NAD(P)-dependent dehydrogenase (short-subunit alcohol dehydrogenase family)